MSLLQARKFTTVVPILGAMALILNVGLAWFVMTFDTCLLYVCVTHPLWLLLMGVRLYTCRQPDDSDEDASMQSKLLRNTFLAFFFLMLGSACISLGLANVKPFLRFYGGTPASVSSIANASVVSAPTFHFTNPVQWLTAARVGVTRPSLVPFAHNSLTPLPCVHNSGVRRESSVCV
jgi:hypothetical protein